MAWLFGENIIVPLVFKTTDKVICI